VNSQRHFIKLTVITLLPYFQILEIFNLIFYNYSLKFESFLPEQFQAQINYFGIIENCCVVGLIIDFLLFIWYNLAIYNEECNFKGMER